MRQFVITILFSLASMFCFGQVQPNVKIIDEGGSGVFKAIAVKEAGAEDFVVYRPKDMAYAHARCGALPLLMWANGACVDTSAGYERNMLRVARATWPMGTRRRTTSASAMCPWRGPTILLQDMAAHTSNSMEATTDGWS